MEILLLIIYSFFVWLIFIKKKWLPWNITSQVIVVTIPIIALTVLILFMNIVAPSSHDVRAMNYVVPVVPRVTGTVTEVPIEPNRPIKKGDVLFKMDPVPFEASVKAAESEREEAETLDGVGLGVLFLFGDFFRQDVDEPEDDDADDGRDDERDPGDGIGDGVQRFAMKERRVGAGGGGEQDRQKERSHPAGRSPVVVSGWIHGCVW